MRKQITLAIVAALFGLAITFAAMAGLTITFREVVVTTSADVIHPAEKLLSAFDARLPLQEATPSRTAGHDRHRRSTNGGTLADSQSILATSRTGPGLLIAQSCLPTAVSNSP